MRALVHEPAAPHGLWLGEAHLMTNRQTTGAVLEVSGGESLVNTLD